MADKLAAAKSMSFTALTIFESPDRTGLPLAYTTLSQVTMQRPDKLKVISPGDGPRTEFYYDGKTVRPTSRRPSSWPRSTHPTRQMPCCARPSSVRRSTSPSPTSSSAIR